VVIAASFGFPERVVGTLRREYLGHVLPLSAAHLRTILTGYADSSHTERPPRTLGLETPRPGSRSSAGAVLARPVLRGLHDASARAA